MEDRVYCEICGIRDAVHECRMCGRLVCNEHYDVQRRLCSICSSSLCAFCHSRLSIGYCIVCGRPGCRSCLIQIDPSRRICRECLSRTGGLEGVERTLCRPGAMLARSLWG